MKLLPVQQLKELTLQINKLVANHEALFSEMTDYLYKLDVNSTEYKTLEKSLCNLIPDVHEEYYTFL